MDYGKKIPETLVDGTVQQKIWKDANNFEVKKTHAICNFFFLISIADMREKKIKKKKGEVT